jgi:hypothetical protein
MSEHRHSFVDSEWPFSDPINTAAFTTVRVVRDGYPVLLVSHDEEGDWQMLCGTTNDTADALVVCLGCAYQRDRSIGELADLPPGCGARGLIATRRDGPRAEGAGRALSEAGR